MMLPLGVFKTCVWSRPANIRKGERSTRQCAWKLSRSRFSTNKNRVYDSYTQSNSEMVGVDLLYAWRGRNQGQKIESARYYRRACCWEYQGKGGEH
eukprot:1697353-Heterocapsa_arctica.AAC.1